MLTSRSRIQKRYAGAATLPRSRGSDRARLIESFESLGYRRETLEEVPSRLLERSFPAGCPHTSLALRPGDTLVDIGAGNGLDCFMLARQGVARTRIVGIDVTPEAAARASALCQRAPDGRACFAASDAASLALQSSIADWVTINGLFCVIPDPSRVAREAFRILRPGGGLHTSVLTVDLPSALRPLAKWLAGVHSGRGVSYYREALEEAGFRRVRIVTRHRYAPSSVRYLWGAGARTRALVQWAGTSHAGPLATRILEWFEGVELTAVKPIR